MSYEIIYNRQFIKVDDNRVIPFIEMGSNNCYEAHGTGRKRARSWGSSRMFSNGSMMINNDELLVKIDEYEIEVKESCANSVKEYNDESWAYDAKRFGYHTAISFYGRSTRSTSFGAFKSYYKNGIKEAVTIEELFERGVRIELCVYYWREEDITSKGLEIKPSVLLKSTQQMIDAITEYESYYGNKASVYIAPITDWSLENFISDKRIGKRKEKKPKVSVDVNEYYVLRSTETGGYFVRNTARGYKYSFYVSGNVKAFITEKEAENFKKKMRNGDLFVIEKREGLKTFLK